MRCRVCKEKAAIEVRRHNAAFCPGHFIEHIQRQVARAIHDYRMIAPEDRLLLAVSGGKDSLALWDVLTDLGYEVDGLTIDLGIGEYSSESAELTRRFAQQRSLQLHTIDLSSSYGFDIPGAASATRRTACSACGLSKRYVLNEEARRRGYDTLVMGHNLDDEAATLFSNVLNWNVEYLGRQRPVLEGGDGFVRKIKPLIRVGERETAAYAVLRGIEYEVAECPMAGGNTLNRLKEWMAMLENRSPGTVQHFLQGFLDRGSAHFGHEAVDVHPCAVCGSPTTGEICAFCRLRSRAGAHS